MRDAVKLSRADNCPAEFNITASQFHNRRFRARSLQKNYHPRGCKLSGEKLWLV
ncbi:hypothetical protein H6F77_03255 [Microcoleus sp. FACHB-831]|nr:hypothetical protein [Microcoleus sp. FACHB-831]